MKKYFILIFLLIPAYALAQGAPAQIHSSDMAPGAAAGNMGITTCNAIGISTCLSGTGPILYTDIQNWGSGSRVGGNVLLAQSTNDNSSSFLTFLKTRQSTKGSSTRVPVQPGDGLSEISSIADDGTNFQSAATENFSVDGPVSTGIVPVNYQIWVGNTTGTHTLDWLLDSHGNGYLRNGNLGIGSYYGYNPPAFYSSGIAPPYPISIVESASGTYFGAFQNGTTGGGAQIEVSNGFSATTPIYGFWYNSNSGLGNPAANVVSIINSGYESWRMDVNRHESYNAGTLPTVSACGTSPAIDAYATDNSGTITTGTGTVTSCTLTFRVAYATYVECTVTAHTGQTYSYNDTSLSTIVITGAALSGKFTYRCSGK